MSWGSWDHAARPIPRLGTARQTRRTASAWWRTCWATSFSPGRRSTCGWPEAGSAASCAKGRTSCPDVPALSTLRTSSKELTYRTLSSFSFEGESGTGLREELGLDGRGDSTISIEYSFREDSPHLSIRGEIRSPMLADALRVNQYSPLTLALREVERGETIPVEAWAPDGSTSRATIVEDRPPVVLPGARHRLPRKDGGWIVLCYTCPDGGSWGMPSFRITRQRGKRFLVVNSFGCETPFPAAAMSGRRESFSMLLGLEDA